MRFWNHCECPYPFVPVEVLEQAESQNWFMPMAYRKLGRGTLQLRGMFSAEPFTFPPGGSPLPAWLGEADVDVYAAEFARTGFRGGLNWYRNIDRNWELTAPWSGARITVPALYVVGDRDVVYHFPGGGPQLVTNLSRYVPNLKQGVVLEGCGHWTQQERPAQVNRLLVELLRSL